VALIRETTSLASSAKVLWEILNRRLAAIAYIGAALERHFLATPGPPHVYCANCGWYELQRFSIFP